MLFILGSYICIILTHFSFIFDLYINHISELSVGVLVLLIYFKSFDIASALSVSLTSGIVAPGIGKPAGHPNGPQHRCWQLIIKKNGNISG